MMPPIDSCQRNIMIDRRTLLGRAGALAIATGAMPAMASVPDPATTAGTDAALARLLQIHVELFLKRCPEEATSGGFDTGSNAALRSQLTDRSLAAMITDRGAVKQGIAALARVERTTLSPRALEDLDVANFVYTTLDDVLGRYGYVDIDLRPSPYVVSQMNGAYYWLPDFIGGRHPLAGPSDADAYLLRLAGLGVALDQESERIAHDASIGVVPPSFVLDRTIAQIKALRDGDPAKSALIAPAIGRGGPAFPAASAIMMFSTHIAPALSRQIAALEAIRSGAVDTAGVWRLPDGEAYYAAAVRANTTTDLAPAELHRIGLAQVASLTAELDLSLRAQGYTSGSVGDRIGALNKDTRFLKSEDDTGRAALIAYLHEVLTDTRARLPQMFSNIPIAPITVRRIPEAVENGAPGAFYDPGSAGQPGIFSLNLRSPAEQPTWRLPTLAHHEGIPGHHFQYSALASAAELSPFRRIVRFSAYTEGWALYAEQVADELGCYEKDPVGRIGYLQSMLFRAGRVVVDTGIHYKRWTRTQAIQWMIEHIGESPIPAAREIDRYCVYPGQACSFKVGQNQIVALREAARTQLGSRFDVRAFHDIVLLGGPTPMQTLAGAVGRWSGLIQAA
jgi:uncharacterized protein (DUF885 family)